MVSAHRNERLKRGYDESGQPVYVSAQNVTSAVSQAHGFTGFKGRGEVDFPVSFGSANCHFQIPYGAFEFAVTWKLPTREIRFPRQALVMGIVNVNDDSFSGDGTLDPHAALEQALRHAEQGADVIDVGAESARTNRPAVSPEEEIRRFRGFLEQWPSVIGRARPKDEIQVWPPVLSVNTWRPEVVEAVLPFGAELVNDMGGLPDDRNARLCAGAGASLLIMHSAGEPKVPHFHQQWDDVMAAMGALFEEKIAVALGAGMLFEALILDPGIDFAKQREDNLRVFRELEALRRFERPVMVPVSRKTVIGEVLGIADPCERDAGTVACTAAALRRGAAMVRVHDVRAAWQAVRTLAAIEAA
jgi:dihydropteroate synthase